MAHGALLTELAELACRGLYRASATRDAALRDCRRRVAAALGRAALLDACAVVGMFNGINIIADMCGVAVDGMTAPFAEGMLETLRVDAPPNWAAAARAKL